MLPDKVIQYLKNELKHSTNQLDINNRREIIDFLKKSKGECFGYSVLWVYGQRIADEPPDNENKPKDDIRFFHYVQDLLNKWDGIKPFSPSEKMDIERFISHTLHYQRILDRKKTYSELVMSGYDITDLSSVLEDTKRGIPVRAFKSEAMIVSKNMLKKRLANVIHPKLMMLILVYLKDGGHVLAVYQNSNTQRYHYYNYANDRDQEVGSIDALADEVWAGSNPDAFRSSGIWGGDITERYLRHIRFVFYQFKGDPIYQYPNPTELKVQYNEFKQLLLQYSKYLSLNRDNHLTQLIDTLDSLQLITLLNDREVDPEIKNPVIAYCLKSRNDTYQLVARYLHQYRPQLLIDFVATGVLTQKDINIMINRLADMKINIDTLSNIPPQHWVSAYHLHLLQKADFAALTVVDCLQILIEYPGYTVLAEFLLDHCNKERDYDNNALTSVRMASVFWNAVRINIETNNIQTAKMILLKIGKIFDRGLSLATIKEFNNLEIAEFIYANFPSNYLSVNRDSYLLFIIEQMKNPPVRVSTSTLIPAEQPVKNPAYDDNHIAQDNFQTLRGRRWYIDLSRKQAEEFLTGKKEGSYLIIPHKNNDGLDIVCIHNGKIEFSYLHGGFDQHLLIKMVEKDPTLLYPVADQVFVDQLETKRDDAPSALPDKGAPGIR